MKVLLVENSRALRNTQLEVLAQLGHTDVEQASDGHDALSKAQACPPQLLLVSDELPSMDGLALVRQFRARDRQTPIILTSEKSEKTHVLAAIKAGVNDYIVKPFTPELLRQRITETMAKATHKAA